MKLLILLTSIVLINGQEFGWGGCPSAPKPLAKFDLSRFLGVWYESGRYFNAYEVQGSCPYIKLADGGNALNVTHRFFEFKTLSGKTTTINSTKPTTEGKFTMKIGEAADYYVLNTDYTSWASLYACRNFFFFHYKYGFSYSRQRLQVLNEYQNAKNAFTAAGLSLNNFNATDQLACLLFN